MADRNPKAGTPTPSVDTKSGETNKLDGLQAAPGNENHSDVNLMAIGPNKPRPIETTATHHLFGSFSD
jgi:hypothetical protein